MRISKTEPVHTTPSEDGELSERGGGTRSHPQRIAAQVARYRLRELARDPY